MAASIKLDQAAHPPGVAGKAREDLATGTAVTATASGGPFLAHQWSFKHLPIDIVAGVRATTAIAAPTSSATALTPIDVAGTYLLELVVDSGAGLGANPGDTARITFYAGPTLNASPILLPRRIPAFLETLEHNVNDAIDVAGNPEGWSREWYRWFAVLDRLYDGSTWCSGRVVLTGVSATLTRGFNVTGAGLNRTGLGTVDVTFQTALPDANYAVIATARSTAGMLEVLGESSTKFTLKRRDGSGALVDSDFNFLVTLGA